MYYTGHPLPKGKKSNWIDERWLIWKNNNVLH